MHLHELVQGLQIPGTVELCRSLAVLEQHQRRVALHLVAVAEGFVDGAVHLGNLHLGPGRKLARQVVPGRRQPLAVAAPGGKELDKGHALGHHTFERWMPTAPSLEVGPPAEVSCWPSWEPVLGTRGLPLRQAAQQTPLDASSWEPTDPGTSPPAFPARSRESRVGLHFKLVADEAVGSAVNLA
uniref:Putative thioredoxin/protein disulfide isomerase n=1 Tax=Ixodes ricinus TaxID=34613 RepID=A0A0K8RM87_IXORI